VRHLVGDREVVVEPYRPELQLARHPQAAAEIAAPDGGAGLGGAVLALRLVAAGIGDTYLPSAYTRAAYFPPGLRTTSFVPALHDTFAIVSRPGRTLTPGVRELLADLEAHMTSVAAVFDRSR
jgi:DNA-binding transcriptional LysR family regulator